MLQRLFGFDPVQHKVRTEIYAGITTFLTMAYILAVNPGIFSALEPLGMPTGAVFTATVLASVIGTLAMALYAKKPFALAPGMGINAFFVFTVCLGMGHTWQFALTAVFIEGILFIILSLFKVRELIANAIPAGLKAAIGGGIGLFIAFIGLQNCGIIVSNESTQVALATFNKPSILLALIGLVICGLLVVRNVMGGLLWGILLTALIGIPMGVTHLDKVFSTPPSIAPIFLQFEWSQILSWDMLIVVFTFLFVDMFDTIGTVIAVSLKADMVDREGKVEGVGRMLMADAVATAAGACLGTSTTTTYVESAAGVAVGGRTGLTSFVVAICFALALFLGPLFLAIPAAATGPALVIVGVMMLTNTTSVDWGDYTEAIPAFITMLLMPLSYSISDGIMLGLIMYVLMKVAVGKKGIRQISPTVWVLFVVQFIEIPVTVPQSHRGRIDILHKTVCLGIGKRDSDFGRFSAVGDILSGKRYVNFTVASNRLVHHGNLFIRDERLRATSVQRTGRCTAVQADGHGPDHDVAGRVLGLLNLFGDVLFFRTAPHHGTCQNKDGHAQVSHCLFHLALRLAGHYHVNSGCWM